MDSGIDPALIERWKRDQDAAEETCAELRRALEGLAQALDTHYGTTTYTATFNRVVHGCAGRA
jgi:hypothetical protein